MKRRRFLVTGLTLLAGGYVAGRFAAEHQLSQFAEQNMAAQLLALRGRAITANGAWSPAQIFAHLAQSIEYSLDGYPQAKPAWFQQTVGATAFSAFAAAGAMTHNLAEPIPGAPPLLDEADVSVALERLLAALQRFDAHAGSLAPHFAYGALDKRQYRAAHLMHIRNHWQELQLG